MSNDHLLLIFIKNPRKGKVKTRLAKTLGNEQALTVYQELLSVTKMITMPLDVDRQVWYSSYIADDDRWSNTAYEKRLQSGADLGQRMSNAFEQAFADRYEKVVVIGSDCADLTTAIIQKAFTALDENEAVIGPSRDGGYYLLGMRSFYSVLFENIDWSTSSVFEQTKRKIDQLGLKLQELQTLNDIDTEQDLAQSSLKLNSV